MASGELPNIKARPWRPADAPMLTCRAEPVAVARMVVTRFDGPGREEVLRLLAHPETIPEPEGQRSANWRRYQRATLPPEEFARLEAERTGASKRREAARGGSASRGRA